MNDIWWYANITMWGLSAPLLIRGAQAWVEDNHNHKLALSEQPVPRRVVAVVVAGNIQYRVFSAYSKPAFEIHVFGEDQFERAQGLEIDSLIFLGLVGPENRCKFMTRVGGGGNKVIRK